MVFTSKAKSSQKEAIQRFDLIDWTALNYIFIDQDLENKSIEIYNEQIEKIFQLLIVPTWF